MEQQHQQARLANQQMRQRIRELQQGELWKRMCEMKRENHRLFQRLKCKICRVEDVQVLLSPCNHLVCCQNCVSNLPKKECPICVTKIQGTIKMFFAWAISYFLNTMHYICQRVLAAATCLKFHFEYCKCDIILLFLSLWILVYSNYQIQWMKENCCWHFLNLLFHHHIPYALIKSIKQLVFLCYWDIIIVYECLLRD